jgi:hypothetical protein
LHSYVEVDGDRVRGSGGVGSTELTPTPELTTRCRLRVMDGLTRTIGDGITGLVGGALGFIESALAGMVAALGSALPAGALPVIVGAIVLIVLWRVLRH